MKALKNLSLLLLLVLAFTGCHNKSSKLADFNRTVYTPEYASGFDIKGADGKKSVLVTVTNPWQGADSITTNLFIARDDEEVPADFTGQMLKGDAAHRLHVLDPYRHARRNRRNGTRSRRVRHRLHLQSRHSGTAGQRWRCGLRREHQLRTAALA